MILDYRIIAFYIFFIVALIGFSPILKKNKPLFKTIIRTYIIFHILIICIVFKGYIGDHVAIDKIAKEIAIAEQILLKYLTYGAFPIVIYIMVTNNIFEKVIDKITIKSKYLEIVLSNVDDDINHLNEFLTIIPNKLIEYANLSTKECLKNIIDDFKSISHMDLKYDILLYNDCNESLEITLLDTSYYILIFGNVTNIQLLVIDRLLVEFERIYNNLLKQR